MKIKTGRLPAPGVGLEALVDEFLAEKIESCGMSIERAARFRASLVGLSSPNVIGFTRFLRATGVIEPTTHDLSSDAVAAFYEFTLQHSGALRSADAVRALRNFWIWCKKNGLTREQKMPPDLRVVELEHPWHIQTSILS